MSGTKRGKVHKVFAAVDLKSLLSIEAWLRSERESMLNGARTMRAAVALHPLTSFRKNEDYYRHAAGACQKLIKAVQCVIRDRTNNAPEVIGGTRGPGQGGE